MNKDSSKTGNTSDPKAGEINFNGAAILNADGSETPITEAMVRAACRELVSESGTDSKKPE